jgi:hypothetical protein
MYIVTKNNPYYPSVRYCDSMAEAEEQRDEWISVTSDNDGRYHCKVTIAQVIETRDFKCD